MRKFFQIAAWVVVIGGVGGWWFSIEHNAAKNEKAQETMDKDAQEEKQKAIAQLSNKYNAVSDWSEPLPKKLFMSIFTMEVEDVLLRKDNRPVLFFATVEDVERKENKYLVRFVAEDLLTELPKIEFVLDCNDVQARIILQQRQSESGGWEKYAVVAVINKVKKVVFSVNPVVVTDVEENYGEIEIDTPNTFMAIGHCVDLLFVENHDYIRGE